MSDLLKTNDLLSPRLWGFGGKINFSDRLILPMQALVLKMLNLNYLLNMPFSAGHYCNHI